MFAVGSLVERAKVLWLKPVWFRDLGSTLIVVNSYGFASLDKMLYSDCLSLLASKKHQIYEGRSQTSTGWKNGHFTTDANSSKRIATVASSWREDELASINHVSQS